MGSENQNPRKQENALHSILLNVILPVIILMQGHRVLDKPAIVLVIALAFPVLYFIRDYRRRKKVNFISIIGFVSVLLTGGVGLLQLPRFWFIVKETAIPSIIGLAVLGSLFTRFPLIRTIVFSKELFDVDRIHDELENRGNTDKLERLLRVCTVLLSVSFAISAVLNFVLASYFVQTEPSVDPAKFNAEVGAMTGWSFLVISVPSTLILIGILFLIFGGIKKHTGLKIEEMLAEHHRIPEEKEQETPKS